jgi:hypothetical protein
VKKDEKRRQKEELRARRRASRDVTAEAVQEPDQERDQPDDPLGNRRPSRAPLAALSNKGQGLPPLSVKAIAAPKLIVAEPKGRASDDGVSVGAPGAKPTVVTVKVRDGKREDKPSASPGSESGSGSGEDKASPLSAAAAGRSRLTVATAVDVDESPGAPAGPAQAKAEEAPKPSSPAARMGGMGGRALTAVSVDEDEDAYYRGGGGGGGGGGCGGGPATGAAEGRAQDSYQMPRRASLEGAGGSRQPVAVQVKDTLQLHCKTHTPLTAAGGRAALPTARRRCLHRGQAGRGDGR